MTTILLRMYVDVPAGLTRRPRDSCGATSDSSTNQVPSRNLSLLPAEVRTRSCGDPCLLGFTNGDDNQKLSAQKERMIESAATDNEW